MSRVRRKAADVCSHADNLSQDTMLLSLVPLGSVLPALLESLKTTLQAAMMICMDLSLVAVVDRV